MSFARHTSSGLPRSPRVLPPMPAWVRFLLAGVVLALLAYAFFFLETVENVDRRPDELVEKVVPVPELDMDVLAAVHDADLSERLVTEPEPLRHLLQKAINVGPSVAAALQMPAEMVPVADLRDDIDDWRLRWLYYEGQLAQLAGPKDGHPIDGYHIYEATIDLADGDSVIAAVSIVPERVQVGDWVRTEGYLMKLRDVTYPRHLERVPMLVGKSLQRDHEDWGPVTELDRELLANVDDTSMWPGELRYRSVEQDQTEAAWHLAAYARDTAASRSDADWLKVPTLNAAETFEPLRNNEIRRGQPLRIFGELIRRRTIAAPANPAGIKYWTTVLVQATSFGGHLIPVWIPKRVADLPMHAGLEVRGFYYRWYTYDAKAGRISVPLFIAADLDTFELETGETMRTIGIGIGGVVTVFLILVIWSQRRVARASQQHSRDMDARRRRRRERATARTAEAAPSPGAPDA